MQNERTLVLLKPVSIQRALVGEIVSRFENKGLKIVGMKMIHISKQLAKEHYSHLVSKPFYPDLEKFMTEHPVIAMVIEGKEAVEVVRNMCGVTNATKAAPGTIRGDLSFDSSFLANTGKRAIKNLIHASGTVDEALYEIPLWFSKGEIVSYRRAEEEAMR